MLSKTKRTYVLRVLPVLLSTTMFSNHASAKDTEQFYLGLTSSSQDISIHGREFNTLGTVIGYRLNQYVTLESRLAFGAAGLAETFKDIETNEQGFTQLVPVAYMEQDIESQFGLSLKGHYPLSEQFNLYALVGFSYTQSLLQGNFRQYAIVQQGQGADAIYSRSDEYSIEEYKDTYTDQGISFGIGVDYRWSANYKLFLDYQRLPEFKRYADLTAFDSKADNWGAITLGVGYLF